MHIWQWHRATAPSNNNETTSTTWTARQNNTQIDTQRRRRRRRRPQRKGTTVCCVCVCLYDRVGQQPQPATAVVNIDATNVRTWWVGLSIVGVVPSAQSTARIHRERGAHFFGLNAHLLAMCACQRSVRPCVRAVVCLFLLVAIHLSANTYTHTSNTNV